AVGASSLSLVAVTALTSLDDASLRELGLDVTVSTWVSHSARLAKSAALSGVVAAADELPALSQLWPEGRFVVPGIRMAGDEVGDQRRVCTPHRAILQGATDIVVGRAVVGAARPGDALARVWDDIAQGERL
ncbi:MAG TPA: orotidine 5'-phosphate decarboxylase / HUMPS family protein, partial [Mycobacterium sp.]|nr:orotidine 5'-phosphate decarboxylase / HUMPS family protein [Mycobacterium sp.]